jgi:5-methylcytosine-specific restriction endonuclease McrA
VPWRNQEAKKAYGRRWYLANRKRKAAQDKQRQSSPEFRLAQRPRSRAYYYANRERILGEKKEYHLANRDRNLERMTCYRRSRSPQQRAKYREDAKKAKRWQRPHIIAHRAEYYRLHRDEAKLRDQKRRERDPATYKANRSARWHKRRAILLGLNEHFSEADWTGLKKRYGHQCLRCHRCEPEIQLTADHVIPLSRGGGNTVANLQPLCGDCNCWKGTKTIDFRPHSSACLKISRRASANHPGPADELNMILPFTAESDSLKHSPASG